MKHTNAIFYENHMVGTDMDGKIESLLKQRRSSWQQSNIGKSQTNLSLS